MISDQQMTHNSTDVSPDLRLHYLDAGGGPRTICLLHGFPQTSHEWVKVIPHLVAAGLRVICPDYRGAGHSSRPTTGYDKWTMAADIQILLRKHIAASGPIIIAGHDIGAMVATMYAFRFPDEISHLVLIDAPILGTSPMEKMRGDPRGWHIAFQSARDIAELLVQGRERAYIQYMIGVRIFDPSAIGPEDFEIYAGAYEAAGAMRAAFELYRAFDADSEMLKHALATNGKLKCPTLTIGGEISALGNFMPDMAREIAEVVDHRTAPRTGHWVPEENPTFLADEMIRFVAKRMPSTMRSQTRTRILS